MTGKTITVVLAVLFVSACVPTERLATAGPRDAALSEIEAKFGPPVMRVARPASPPVIDGKLDDKAWAKAQPVVLGFLTGRWEAPTERTEARVLADAKAVYFAVKCFESRPGRMIAAGGKRDGDLWSGDTVEVFLDPGHKQTRSRYTHVIVNPAGLVYDSKNGNAAWNADLSVKAGRFSGGWTVELALPMADLGVEGAVPKVWGLNINRQRPELGVVSPVRGITSTAVKLKDPGKYREGEDTSFSPTRCHSSHIPMRFGHALLEAGTVEVDPPEKLIEIIYKYDFEDGKAPGWSGVKVVEESFRGPGKCIAPAAGKGAIQFARPLTRLDDVTLVMAFKMPANGRLYYYGRAPDNEQCEADRHEVFMTKEQAERRKFPAMDDYDTHGSMMAWKSHGRLRKVPGPWAMMTGHFSEPSIGSVMQPGTDWAILRTRLGQMRRQRSQGMVPLSQNYPRGLTFATGSPYLIGDFIIFRGADLVGPERVTGVAARREGGQVKLSWKRARDNVLTAYYRVFAGTEKLAETHQLTAAVPAERAAGKALTVVAVDLYENASRPSAPVKAPK
jgi:hypothetical protein